MNHGFHGFAHGIHGLFAAKTQRAAKEGMKNEEWFEARVFVKRFFEPGRQGGHSGARRLTRYDPRKVALQ